MSNTPDETLKGLLETAKGARLSPADEEQAFHCLKETIAAGKKGLATTLDALVILPWSLGVKAIAETWPTLKPTTQRQLLAAVNKLDSEQGKRMRLSIARGLFALDQTVSIKLILKFCSEMDCDSAKERQQFSNVLIGKTKPWVISIPLKELKPAEANSLAKCVLVSCLQAPAFTQVAIYGWIAEAGLFAKLSEQQISAVATTVKRWQPRWHKELKKTVPTLPAPVEEAIAASAASKPKEAPAPALKPLNIPYPGRLPKTQRQGNQGASSAQPQRPAQAEEKSSTPQEPAVEITPATPEAAEPVQPKEHRPEPRPEQKAGPKAAPVAARQQKEPPRNHQRPAGGQAPQGGGFDLQRSLSEIQGFVNGLRAENLQLKNQLRKRESSEPRERTQPSSEELEALRRHNLQLEETIAHLRHDINELISDHEDRASTLEHSTDLQQFKTLLGFKLGKDFYDFEALRRESATEVVRRHLGDLLSHIFSVLKNEGVEFKDTE